MPKGRRKRTKADYEREIKAAVKRFKKYPERKTASRDVDDWNDFLNNIGVNPEAISNGDDFWEKVREKIVIDTLPKLPPIGIESIESLIKEYENRKVYIETTRTNSYYKEIYSETKTVYRDLKTGRFIKK